MSVPYSPYQFILVLLAGGLLFAAVPLILARWWARKMTPGKAGPVKNAPYECGLPSAGTGHLRIKSEYYLFGILFLVLDVEALFLFPFAVSFLDLPVGGFVALLVFLVLLGEGLAWAWWKGLLTWR